MDELLRWQTQFPSCGVNDNAQEGHARGGAFALMSSKWYPQVQTPGSELPQRRTTFDRPWGTQHHRIIQVVEDIAHSVFSYAPF